MKAREYDVLVRAVEEGVAYGWARARKYTKPTPEAEREALVEAVVNAICEWFEFEHHGTETDGEAERP